jgi:hypothetical protein
MVWDRLASGSGKYLKGGCKRYPACHNLHLRLHQSEVTVLLVLPSLVIGTLALATYKLAFIYLLLQHISTTSKGSLLLRSGAETNQTRNAR